MLRNLLVIIVFGAAALVGVWDLLQIEAFDNALVQFATAGVIPGTHTALSPGQVYATLCAVLLLAICLLFRRAIVRDWREFRAAFKHAPAAADLRPADLIQPVGPLAVVPPVAAGAPLVSPQPASASVQPDQVAVVITIPGAPGLLSTWCRAVMAWYRPAATRLGHYMIRRSRQDARLLRVLLIRWSNALRRTIIHAWHFAEPRIRALDARIERRVKRHSAVAQAIASADRLYALMHDRIGGWRAKAQRSVEK